MRKRSVVKIEDDDEIDEDTHDVTTAAKEAKAVRQAAESEFLEALSNDHIAVGERVEVIKPTQQV
jgi:hypothetical protein